MGVYGSDVSSAQPTVSGKALACTRIVVIGGRNPIATALQFSTCFAVPCNRVSGAWHDNAGVNTKCDLADSCAQLCLL
jgi:hypothetical protein